MARVFLGLGSNVGDRMGYLKRAVETLQNIPGIHIYKTSSVYETEPWGKEDQGAFLNQVIEIETGLGANVLLKQCKRIE